MFSGYHYSYLSYSFTIFLMVIAPSFSFPSTVACSTSSTSAASIRIPLSRVDSSVDHFVLVFIVLLPYSFVSLSPIFYPSLQLLTWSRELLLSLAAVDVFKRCLRRIRHSEPILRYCRLGSGVDGQTTELTEEYGTTHSRL